jgi:flagellar biosynthesis/type III secretory pathway protein FliH
MLLERGYKERQADHVFRFMDYVLALPEEMEVEFDREVSKFAEEGKGMYLSRFERRAMERGVQQGLEQGIQKGLKKGLEQGKTEGKIEGKIEGQIAAARAAVVEVLESRFNRVPRKVSSQLNKITDAGRLRALIRHAATAATVKDFERQLSS